jgi:parallel beta-helix repeat protein
MRKNCINLILIVLLLVSSYAKLNAFYPDNENVDSISPIQTIPAIPKKLPGAEIRILSDDDWSDYSFTGSGALNDPYLIEDLDINTEKKHGIYIQDTSKYFIIRNCSISADDYGIYILRVEPGCTTIIDNTIHNNDNDGICMFLSGYSTINSNIIKFNGEGIYVTGSESCTIDSNLINYNKIGVDFDGSDGSSISNNRFQNNDFRSINIVFSAGNRIENNIIFDFLNIWESEGSLLRNNKFYDSSLRISDSTTAAIAENEFLNGGIIFSDYNEDYLSRFVIHDNTVNGKEIGLFMNLQNSTIEDSIYGQIILSNCDSLTIKNQSLSSTSYGLVFYNCNNIQVSESNCSDNSYEGIAILSSDDINITNNNFHCNQNNGIMIYSSRNCLIEANNFSKNDDYGVYIETSQKNQIFRNNFLENNQKSLAQGFDDSKRNKWYNVETKEGNYWSDLGENCTYLLDGDSGARDLYPLNRPLTCWDPKLKTTLILSVPISSLVVFYIIYYFVRYIRKKKLL